MTYSREGVELQSHGLVFGCYTEQARDVAKSLVTSPASDGNGLKVSFTINDELFEVQGAHLRREKIYKTAVYPDLLLHLTEVQNLDVRRDVNDLKSYRGSLKCQSEMTESHRLWWEVSISSQRAASILEENQSLEIGEKAQWRPNDPIEGDVVEDLFELSRDIVSKIDFLGARNKGPMADHASRLVPKPSERSQDSRIDSRLGSLSMW